MPRVHERDLLLEGGDKWAAILRAFLPTPLRSTVTGPRSSWTTPRSPTRSSTTRAPASRRCSSRRASSRATASASCCRTSRTSPLIYYGVLRAGGVVVPMNPLLKGREVSFYLEDPGAKIMFAWHGFEEAARKGADEAGAELILVEPGEFEKLVAEHEPEHRRRRARRRRHRGDPLHVGHDRQAQGRRADPREPDDERAGLGRRPRRGHRGRRAARARCRCSTRSARPAA